MGKREGGREGGMREKGKRALYPKTKFFIFPDWSYGQSGKIITSFFVRTVYVSGMRTWPAADMRVCLQQPS